MGIYILYKKLYKKEHIFSSNNNDFEQTIAKTDKQIRIIKNSYGENPQVKKLLLEIGTEKNIIISERKKSKVIAIGITVGIFATFCLIGYLQPKPISKRVEQLIEEGKIEEAKAVVNKLKSTDYSKATLQTKITEVEVEKLIEEKKFNEALQAASLIKSEYERNNLIGKIIESDVNLLITLKEFKKAKLKAADINEEYKRQQLIQKITNAEKFNK
jgi:DNA-binding Lrp family transcriptional regulator